MPVPYHTNWRGWGLVGVVNVTHYDKMSYMKAEIVSVGTELLIGSIVNSNARFLSEELARHAIDVYCQVTVGDNISRISKTLRTALDRSDVVITTGGLGPTEDDVTAQAICHALDKPLIFHKPTYRAISARLAKQNYRMTRLIARQASIPKGATALQNKVGTAPALFIETKIQNQKKWLIALPGPPKEMVPLFTEKALPLLLRRSHRPHEVFKLHSLKIAGVLEATVAEKIKDVLKWPPPLTVGIYAKPGEVELKIMAKARGEKNASRLVAHAEKIIRRRLGSWIYGADNDTLSSVVGKLLRLKHKTLSTAESCTGGLVSHWLTETPGSSDYFLGGVIAYDNRVKISKLMIEKSLIARDGAVSAAVAKKMAQNIRLLFKTDYGVGITGIAGPTGGSNQKPVGLVFIALSHSSGTITKKFRFFGTRSEIKSRAALHALILLRHAL